MAKRILILFVLAAALIGPKELSSCGPFLPETVFTPKQAPLDESRYFAGRLGIIQPRYARIYLMTAYRYLAGQGLSEVDQQALMAKPTGPDFWFDQDSPAIQEWLRMRLTVEPPPEPRIEPFKWYGQATYILNCNDDAFRNAAATLAERARAGASMADLRSWAAAQDQVFANCSTAPPWAPKPKTAAPSIPEPAPASAPPWLQADRAYQIAAAEFYAGQFDDAYAGFLRIAADRSSPWHNIAPYLAARTLIRKATLVDAGAAPAAQAQLEKVLADPDAAPWHESARGLENFLRVQTQPGPMLNELAHTVATQKTGVAGAMNSYRLMLDKYWNRNQEVPREEDITDWLATMQYDADDSALAKWRSKRSLPWLVAALTWADQPDRELMAAAAKIPRTSPAFLTVEFHRLRLMPPEQARPRLDAVLRRRMPAPVRNMFLAARMRVARDWNELLRFAPRTVVASSAPERDFDEDSASILNRQAPLDVLFDAARNRDLPVNLRARVARAAWVRAILLHDTGTAAEIAPVLASLAPYLKPYLDLYVASPDEKTREFAAAWLWLNNPGMRPWIDAGAGRLTPVPKLDILRDNWWCASDTSRRPLNAPLELLYQGNSPHAVFVSADQRAEARRQWKGLTTAPAATTYMARQAVEWARAHPHDPRVPEALHLAVRAGHYACGGDSQTDRWVKRAFEWLHGSYPDSEAARRTRYWYRAGR